MCVSPFCTSGSGDRTTGSGESNQGQQGGIVVQSDPNHSQHSGVESAHLAFHTSIPSPCIITTQYTRLNISIVGPELGDEILPQEIPGEPDRLVW